MTTLADMIVLGRSAKGMTQHDLAVAIEVKAGGAQISKWERGALPERDNVWRIIQVLDLDADQTWIAFGRAVDQLNTI